MIDLKLPVSVIAALTEKDRVIGLDGDMPWHFPEDLARFKEITMGGTLLMGRKTFESLPGVLPERYHIVLSRSEWEPEEDGVLVVDNLREALGLADVFGVELFVCGGQSVYEAFMSPPYLNHVDNLYLTIIEEEYEGDTFFPEYEHHVGRGRLFHQVAEKPMDGFRFEDYGRHMTPEETRALLVGNLALGFAEASRQQSDKPDLPQLEDHDIEGDVPQRVVRVAEEMDRAISLSEIAGDPVVSVSYLRDWKNRILGTPEVTDRPV